jgi:hypothetical protein
VPLLQLKAVFFLSGDSCAARTTPKLEIATATPTAIAPAAAMRVTLKLPKSMLSP